MAKPTDLFELVEEKLGDPPPATDGESPDHLDPQVALLPPADRLPATWFDPSFDPQEDAAISFQIRFSESVPHPGLIEPPAPSPAYVPADAVAVYAPWHIYGDDFGAYIRGDALLALAARIAEDLEVPFGDLAPHVLRQIALHEQAHYMFEVGAAEIEDVAEEWLYHRYLRRTGPWPPLTDGVVEEIWASWREVQYAKRVAGKVRRLRRYPALVANELRELPAGYRDYETMRRQARGVRAAVAALVRSTHQPIVTGRWGAPTGREAEGMPLHWIGDERTLRELGGLPRTVSFPSIARFEKWLRMIGAEIDTRGGRGSHRKVRLPNGRTAGYATSAGRMHADPANQIARELGIGNARVLFEYVRDMRPLPG